MTHEKTLIYLYFRPAVSLSCPAPLVLAIGVVPALFLTKARIMSDKLTNDEIDRLLASTSETAPKLEHHVPRVSMSAKDVARIIFFAVPSPGWPVALELTAKSGSFYRASPDSDQPETVNGKLIDDLLAAVCGPVEGKEEGTFAYAPDLSRFEFKIVLHDGGQVTVASSPDNLSLVPWRITQRGGKSYDSENSRIRSAAARLLTEQLAALRQFRVDDGATDREDSRQDASSEPMDAAIVEERAVRELLRGEVSEELRAEMFLRHDFGEDLARACARAHDRFANFCTARLSELLGQPVEVGRLGRVDAGFCYDIMDPVPPTEDIGTSSESTIISFSLPWTGSRAIAFIPTALLEDLVGALPESVDLAPDRQELMNPVVSTLLNALGDALPAEIGGFRLETGGLRDFVALDDLITAVTCEVRAGGTSGIAHLCYLSDSVAAHVNNLFVPEVVQARFLIRKLPGYHQKLAEQAEKLIPREPEGPRDEDSDPLAAELTAVRADDPDGPRAWAESRDGLETRESPGLWAVRFDPGGVALLSLSQRTMELLDVHVGEDGMYRLTPAETTRLETIVHLLVRDLDDQWGSLMTVADDTPAMVDGRDAGFDDDWIISVHCGNGVTVHYSQLGLEEAVLLRLTEL